MCKNVIRKITCTPTCFTTNLYLIYCEVSEKSRMMKKNWNKRFVQAGCQNDVSYDLRILYVFFTHNVRILKKEVCEIIISSKNLLKICSN